MEMPTRRNIRAMTRQAGTAGIGVALVLDGLLLSAP